LLYCFEVLKDLHQTKITVYKSWSTYTRLEHGTSSPLMNNNNNTTLMIYIFSYCFLFVYINRQLQLDIIITTIS